MAHFNAYRDEFPNARLTRSKTGVLEVAFHTDGGTLVFNGFTHEQFVQLFHAIGSDPDNRVVIMTGSGDAFMERITPDGFDFFSPRGYDKITARCGCIRNIFCSPISCSRPHPRFFRTSRTSSSASCRAME